MENPIKNGWFGGKTHYFWKHPTTSNPTRGPNPTSNGSTDQPLETRENPVGQEKTKGNTLEPKLPWEPRSVKTRGSR